MMRDVMESEHELFRDQFRRFLENEVAPFHDEWEEQGFVPRELWRKAGELGFLCTMIPEEFGGVGGDYRFGVVVLEEIARLNVTGLGFTMHSDIVALYLLAYGTEEGKKEWLPKMISGETIGALGMTEPGTGSDAKAVRTTAVRDGDHYVINGSKTFITNGYNAGLVVVSCKTDPDAGRNGLSLIVVEEGMPGFSKGKVLKKIGLHAQDTAELFFDNVRVPVKNLLGEENKGFSYLMHELAQERISIALRAVTSIEAMLDETIAYTRERKAFGQTVFDFQNTKFKLADAKAEVEMLRVFCDDCLKKHLKGELTAEKAAMAKLVSTEMQNRLLDDFLQLHGGYGFMSEYRVSRAWRDARVMRIYGGSSEVMRHIISRTL
jgi:acyl-CoA dehydrogenase